MSDGRLFRDTLSVKEVASQIRALHVKVENTEESDDEPMLFVG